LRYNLSTKMMLRSKIKKIYKFLQILLLTSCLFSSNSFATTSRNLTIFAEPNMALALTKIARIYSRKYNVIVSVNLNSSENFINEIEFGEPADVFISAHPGWIELMRQKGLIDVFNIGYIAQDRLALITPISNSNLHPRFLKNNISLAEAIALLDKNKETLILDHEGGSSGYKAKKFTDYFDLTNLKIFSKIAEDRTPFLTIIESHPKNYALLLKSQIKNDDRFKTLAIGKNDTIFYQALVIAGDNMEVAREFLKFLKSDIAKSVLKENGFIVS